MENSFKFKYDYINTKDLPYDSCTPIIKQYLDIKKNNLDYIIFFRIGDFYEIFLEDALKVYSILGVVLTRKNAGKSLSIPMCGMPFHSYENYLNKLVKQGFKVAICNQSDTEATKPQGAKIIDRKIARIVTQGTLIEDSLLENSSYNYLMAIIFYKDSAICSWSDVSTGKIYVEKVLKKEYMNLIYSISPKEILIGEDDFILINNPDIKNKSTIISNAKVNIIFAKNILQSRYSSQYNLLIREFDNKEIQAIAMVIDYIAITQKVQGYIAFPKKRSSSTTLRIDSFTAMSLDLLPSAKTTRESSLKYIINFTTTNMGSRMLDTWILNPLKSEKEINKRLKVVQFFIENKQLEKKVLDCLKRIADVERILGRIFLYKHTPLELLHIQHFLISLIEIKTLFYKKELPMLLNGIIQGFNTYNNLLDVLNNALNPAITLSNDYTMFFKKGFNLQLDKLENQKKTLQNDIKALESKYILSTGVKALKVVNNRATGYSIEVSNKLSVNIPSNGELKHKQTLTSCVRYTSDELINYELQLNDCILKISLLQKDLLNSLADEVARHREKLLQSIENIAYLDILISFAKMATTYNLSYPKIDSSNILNIQEGRHLNVEQNTIKEKNTFIANSISMDDSFNLMMLTGPNMSGKSTYLRQNAIIIIMGQMGCFVPAVSAHIGIVDAIFSRVGSMDDISKGTSTFMLEMLELSTILLNATERSFLILDEIGRGTSTYDGLSIAWASIEYIANNINCRTIFATHYHELTKMNIPLLQCYYVDVFEDKGDLIFLHTVKKGSANKSYGVQVAKLAGMPMEMIDRANAILQMFDDSPNNTMFNQQHNLLTLHSANDKYTKLKKDYNHILQQLDVNLDDVSPKEAWDILHKTKQKIIIK